MNGKEAAVDLCSLLHSVLDEFFQSYFGSNNSPITEIAFSKFLDYISLIFKGEVFSHYSQCSSRVISTHISCEPILILKSLFSLYASSKLVDFSEASIEKLSTTLKTVTQQLYLFQGYNKIQQVINSILDLQLELYKLCRSSCFPAYLTKLDYHIASFTIADRFIFYLDDVILWMIRIFSFNNMNLQRLFLCINYRFESKSSISNNFFLLSILIFENHRFDVGEDGSSLNTEHSSFTILKVIRLLFSPYSKKIPQRDLSHSFLSLMKVIQDYNLNISSSLFIANNEILYLSPSLKHDFWDVITESVDSVKFDSLAQIHIFTNEIIKQYSPLHASEFLILSHYKNKDLTGLQIAKLCFLYRLDRQSYENTFNTDILSFPNIESNIVLYLAFQDYLLGRDKSNIFFRFHQKLTLSFSKKTSPVNSDSFNTGALDLHSFLFLFFEVCTFHLEDNFESCLAWLLTHSNLLTEYSWSLLLIFFISSRQSENSIFPIAYQFIVRITPSFKDSSTFIFLLYYTYLIERLNAKIAINISFSSSLVFILTIPDVLYIKESGSMVLCDHFIDALTILPTLPSNWLYWKFLNLLSKFDVGSIREEFFTSRILFVRKDIIGDFKSFFSLPNSLLYWFSRVFSYSLLNEPCCIDWFVELFLQQSHSFVLFFLENVISNLALDDSYPIWLFTLFIEKISRTSRITQLGGFFKNFQLAIIDSQYKHIAANKSAQFFFCNLYAITETELISSHIGFLCKLLLTKDEFSAVSEEKLSLIDDILAHLMILINPFDNQKLMDLFKRLFLKFNIINKCDSISFNEIISSLTVSILLKIFNLIFSYFILDYELKFITSVQFLADHHCESTSIRSLISENLIGLLDIIKPTKDSSHSAISSSLKCVSLLFPILLQDILKYPEYFWSFVEYSVSLEDTMGNQDSLAKFWNSFTFLLEELFASKYHCDNEVFLLFVRIYYFIGQFYSSTEFFFNFTGVILTLEKYLKLVNRITFSLLRVKSSQEFDAIFSAYDPESVFSSFTSYITLLTTLISYDDITILSRAIPSIYHFLKFILLSSRKYLQVFTINQLSFFKCRLCKVAFVLRSFSITIEICQIFLATLEMVDLICSNLAIASIGERSLDFLSANLSSSNLEQNLLSVAKFLEGGNYVEVNWSWLILFIFPTCNQNSSFFSKSPIAFLPFFIAQELITRAFKVSDISTVIDGLPPTISGLLSKLSSRHYDQFIYLLKRSIDSKFKISGFEAIKFIGKKDLDFSTVFASSGQIASPNYILSSYHQILISYIEDEEERYIYSLLRLYSQSAIDSFVHPEDGMITLLDNPLFFPMILLIVLFEKMEVDSCRVLQIIFRTFSLCSSFSSLFPLVKYYSMKLIEKSSPYEFVKLVTNDCCVSKFDLARHFFKSNDFIISLYYFEQAFYYDRKSFLASTSYSCLKTIYKSLEITDESEYFQNQQYISNAHFTPLLNSPILLFPMLNDSNLLSHLFPLTADGGFRNLQQMVNYYSALRMMQDDNFPMAHFYLSSNSKKLMGEESPFFIVDISASAAWKLQEWSFNECPDITHASTQFIPSLFYLLSTEKELFQFEKLLEKFTISLFKEISADSVLRTNRFKILNFYHLLFSSFSQLTNVDPLTLKMFFDAMYDSIKQPSFSNTERSERILFLHYFSSNFFRYLSLRDLKVPGLPFKCLLESLKFSRKSNLHNSFKFIVQSCNPFNTTENFLYSTADSIAKLQIYFQHCKFLWQNKSNDQAIMLLENLVIPFEQLSGEDNDINITELKELQSKFRRKLVHWKICQQSYHLDSILPLFNEAIQLSPKNEKCYFELANFQLKLFSTFKYTQDECSSEELEWILNAMKNLARVIIVGRNLIKQSFPKLLSFWLNVKHENLFASIHKVVTRLFERIEPHQYASQFSHFISRICHARSCVFDLLLKLIVQIFKLYPHGVLWHLMGIYRSSHTLRSVRANSILQISRSTKWTFLIDRGLEFTAALIQLSNTQTSSSIAYIHKEFRSIKKLFPVNIQLPNLTCLSFSGQEPENETTTLATDDSLFIIDIQDKVEIMSSLQRPKKLVFFTKDGSGHIFLCKPKDDLRKDARFMEYLIAIGDLLNKDPYAAKRSLSVRPYAALPLNDECGLIEWVSHTITYRSILNGIYDFKKISTPSKRLKEIAAQKKPEKEIFVNDLLPLFPPVFHEWFYATWCDPSRWFFSRLKYIRSLSIMGIVGWVIGLGDRHGENILLDSTSGEVIHVDFNCLFDKGHLFAKPEVVPFRLTHNMVDALGISKTEGSFKKCAMITLQVIRDNRTFLLRNLEVFVYDPIIEWNHFKPPNKQLDSEVDSAEARNMLRVIEWKVRGIVGGVPHTASTFSDENLNLSVCGQVTELVREATSIDNLCRMYVGWAPFM